MFKAVSMPAMPQTTPPSQRLAYRETILRNQIIAILRAQDAQGFVEACHALVAGGVQVM